MSLKGDEFLINTFNNFIKGYVRIKVYGNYLERFLNRIMFKKINLWHIKKSNDCIEANIQLNDMFKIKNIIRNTKSKVIIHKRIGLPFIISRLIRKKMFVFGIFIFYLGLTLLTSMIWSIEVVGTKRINKDEIISYLAENKIRIGSIKMFFDSEEVKNNLYDKFKDIVWISVNLKGTGLCVNIVESTNKSKEIATDIPCDIISNKNAVIYKIATSEGTPEVKEKDVVKKGNY